MSPANEPLLTKNLQLQLTVLVERKTTTLSVGQGLGKNLTLIEAIYSRHFENKSFVQRKTTN